MDKMQQPQIGKMPTQGPTVSMETIRNAKLYKCECGNGTFFTEKIMLKKISAIMSPTGREELFPMNIIVCDACGKIPPELNAAGVIPEELIAKKGLQEK